MRRLSELEKSEIWDRFEAGESQRSISRRLGRSPSSIRTHLLASGFRRPVPGPQRRPKPAIGRGVEPVRKDAAVVRNCRDRESSLLGRVACASGDHPEDLRGGAHRLVLTLGWSIRAVGLAQRGA
jgi:hypothetical protein